MSPSTAAATLGEVGNAQAELVSIGKAGRNRWKGIRPQTRGVAMNPVDHPLGGGEGKSSGGRHPVVAVGQARGPHPAATQDLRPDDRAPAAHPRSKAMKLDGGITATCRVA